MKENINKGWIDFGLIMGEISLHRSNCQRIIKEFKKLENPSPFEIQEYHESVGAERRLMCIEVWCNDFVFSNQEVSEILNKEGIE